MRLCLSLLEGRMLLNFLLRRHLMGGIFKAQSKRNVSKEHQRIDELDGMCTYDGIIEKEIVEVVGVKQEWRRGGAGWSGLIWC